MKHDSSKRDGGADYGVQKCRVLEAPMWVSWMCALILSFSSLVLAGDGKEVGKEAAVLHDEPVERFLYVPLEDLPLLLGGPNERVFLDRAEFERLQRLARRHAAEKAPRSAWISSADYRMRLDDRPTAAVAGELTIEVLEEGWQCVQLGLSDVRIVRATLDGKPAPLGRDGSLFVRGVGRHRLKLEMQVDVKSSRAVQMLAFRLPRAATSKLELQAPGNVDIKSGLAVIRRTYDPNADRTVFELPVLRERMQIAISVNNRRRQQDRLLTARSHSVSVLSQGSESWRSTIDVDVLHGAAESFQFEFPAGMQVTSVTSPRLTHWSIRSSANGQKLTVRLREPIEGRETIQIVGVRSFDVAKPWQLPKVRLQGAVSQGAVVALVASSDLSLQRLSPSGLISIDAGSWLKEHQPRQPATTETSSSETARAEGPNQRWVATYFAPGDQYDLEAAFTPRGERFDAISHWILSVGKRRLDLNGGVTVQAVRTPVTRVALRLPRPWFLESVTDVDGEPLKYELFSAEEGQRVVVQLGHLVSPGESVTLVIHVRRTDPRLLGEFQQLTVSFPNVVVERATLQQGALAVTGHADLEVAPGQLSGLLPLDTDERTTYGFAPQADMLAYRVTADTYKASFVIRRRKARWNALGHAFFRIEEDRWWAHHELLIEVAGGPLSRLELTLPADTPETVNITAFPIASRESAGDLVRETEWRIDEGRRIWTVHLRRPVRQSIRLVLDYEVSLAIEQAQTLNLALPRCNRASYQSDRVAIEVVPSLEAAVKTPMQAVDVGELAAAHYTPGRHWIGAYQAPADVEAVSLHVARRELASLPPVVVQRAEIVTVVSPTGTAQSAARYRLKTKVPLLSVVLPRGATLWGVMQDGEPVQTALRDGKLIVHLDATSSTQWLDLQVVYETLGVPWGRHATIDLVAPRLEIAHGKDGKATEVAQVEATWHLHLPQGHEVINVAGNMTTPAARAPEFPFDRLIEGLRRVGAVFLVGGRRYAREHAVSTSTAAVGHEDDFLREEKLAAPSFDLSVAPDGPGGGAAVPAEADRRRMEKSDAQEPPLADQPASASEEAGRSRAKQKLAVVPWALRGWRGIPLVIDRGQKAVELSSLSDSPHLRVTVADTASVRWLAVAVALVVFAVGVALPRKPAARRWMWVAAVWTVAVIASTLGGRWMAYTDVYALSAFAATLLLPWWAMAASLQSVCEMTSWGVTRLWHRLSTVVRSAGIIPLLATMCVLGMEMRTAPAQESPNPMTDRPESNHREHDDLAVPLKIPDDAIVVPYRTDAPDGRKRARRVLVPYRTYIDLVEAARRQKDAAGRERPPAPYAVSSSQYRVTLADAGHLELVGDLVIHVWSSQPVDIPLAARQAIIREATLNGRPATLHMPASAGDGDVKQSSVSAQPFRLRVASAGVHRLRLVVHVPVTLRGAWRSVDATLPVGTAAGLEVTVAERATIVRQSVSNGDHSVETSRDRETLSWPMSSSGHFQIAWRPRLVSGPVDRSLTAESRVLVDVASDGVRAAWHGKLTFGQSERNTFDFAIPPNYVVERVLGDNVRSWSVTTAADQTRLLQIELLKAAKESEQVDIHLFRRVLLWEDTPVSLRAPQVNVVGAVAHRGVLAVRKSPALEVSVTSHRGLTRVDVPTGDTLAKERHLSQVGPLELKSFRSFEFTDSAFQLELSVKRRVDRWQATWQTLLRVGETETALEAQMLLNPRGTPVYRLELEVPRDFEVTDIASPGLLEWSRTNAAEDRQRLVLYFPQGRHDRFAVTLAGRFPAHAAEAVVPLPLLQVEGVKRQSGALVVQADAALEVAPADVTGLVPVPVASLSWLSPSQRSAVRWAWAFEDALYRGNVKLAPRQPEIRCDSVSNVRVTYDRIEESVLLDFDIRRAGVRQIVFDLPRRFQDARITAPLIRHMKKEMHEEEVRFILELHDAVMGEYKILASLDRGLAEGAQTAPLPVIRTGKVIYRYVTFENAGRDEIEVVGDDGFVALQRNTRAWSRLREVVPKGVLTMAYVTTQAERAAGVRYRLKRRAALKTAGANIGLARTVLVADASGAYRAVMELRVDNRTESALKIELPKSASLWAVLVAGEPVRPIRIAGKPRQLGIPLVKTAEGDLDYPVEIKYAGRLPEPKAGRDIAFPFVRTVGIEVELSQVTLWLPEEWSWLYFDSTATRLQSHDELMAGFVAYRQRQLENLAQVVERKDWFASARALYNVRSLAKELQRLQRKSTGYSSYSRQLRQSQSMASQVIAQAEQQVAPRRARLAQHANNREAFEWSVESQGNVLPTNEVLRLGRNFQPAKPNRKTPKDAKGQATAAKQLADALQQANQAERPSQLQVPAGAGGPVAGVGGGGFGLGPGGPAPAQAAFAQKLQQSEVMGGSGAPMMAGELREGDSARQPRIPEEASPALIGGWASLDFELPQRGRAFYFSTPRGDVAISARAVPQTWNARVRSWQGAALVVAPLWLIVLIARRWKLSGKARTVMAVLCFVLMVGAFVLALPVAFVFLGLMTAHLAWTRKRV